MLMCIEYDNIRYRTHEIISKNKNSIENEILLTQYLVDNFAMHMLTSPVTAAFPALLPLLDLFALFVLTWANSNASCQCLLSTHGMEFVSLIFPGAKRTVMHAACERPDRQEPVP
jgi:hypothetical protein